VETRGRGRVGRYLEEVNARRGSADGARVTPACRVRIPWMRKPLKSWWTVEASWPT